METKLYKQGGEEGLKGGEKTGEKRRCKIWHIQVHIPSGEYDRCMYLNCINKLNFKELYSNISWKA